MKKMFFFCILDSVKIVFLYAHITVIYFDLKMHYMLKNVFIFFLKYINVYIFPRINKYDI